MDYALYEKAFFNLVPEFERINSGQKRRKSKNVTFLIAVDSLNETLTLFLQKKGLNFIQKCHDQDSH